MNRTACILIIIVMSSVTAQAGFAATVILNFDGFIKRFPNGMSGDAFAPHFSVNDRIQLSITYDAATPGVRYSSHQWRYVDSTPFEISISNVTTGAFTYHWIGGPSMIAVTNDAPVETDVLFDQFFLQGTDPISAPDLNGNSVFDLRVDFREFRRQSQIPLMLSSLDLPTADFDFPEAWINVHSEGGASGLVSIRPVPIPAAVWLLGSALGLLGWMRRKSA